MTKARRAFVNDNSYNTCCKDLALRHRFFGEDINSKNINTTVSSIPTTRPCHHRQREKLGVSLITSLRAFVPNTLSSAPLLPVHWTDTAFCKIKSLSFWTYGLRCPHGWRQRDWVREEAGGSQMPLLLMVNPERVGSFFLTFVCYELLQVPIFSGDFLTFSRTCWITLSKRNYDKEPQGAAPSKWTSELLLLIGLGNCWSTERLGF